MTIREDNVGPFWIKTDLDHSVVVDRRDYSAGIIFKQLYTSQHSAYEGHDALVVLYKKKCPVWKRLLWRAARGLMNRNA